MFTLSSIVLTSIIYSEVMKELVMKNLKAKIEKYQGCLFPILDVLINLVNLFIHIYMSWFIGKDEYGILNAVLSFITVVMVTGISIQFYVAKQVSDPKFDHTYYKPLINYCITSIKKVMVVMVILLPVMVRILRVNYYTMLLVLGIFIINSAVSVLRGIYQGKGQFLLLSASFYIEIVVKVLLTLVMLQIFRDKNMALLGILVGMTVAFYIDYRRLKKLFVKSSVHHDFSGYLKIFFSNFYYYYLTSISLIICNYYLPNSSGVFAVSIRYSQIYIHVGFSIITVLVPVLNKYKYQLKVFKKQATLYLSLCIIGGSGALLFYFTIFPNSVLDLFGTEYLAAGYYMGFQAIGYLLFVISSYFVSMEILLEKKHYITYLFGSAIVLTTLLMFNHKSILQIILNEIAVFSVLSICLAIDFYKKEDLMKDHKTNLLFLSWRDIKAPKKGGAEVFTHEMLKKVDKEKFEITHISPVFDGCEKNEVIDNVHYIRRGNIATVILYAMYYYFKNRKTLDYVIDQCNEHRFFTPLWLPRNKRIFFIHQLGRELWRRNLKFPFSEIGFRLEDTITKIYRKGYTFTVSPSTENDLIEMGFDQNKIGILPEGINFTPWLPDNFLEKENNITFTYVGRFARYKGIDSAIEAFGQLKQHYPNIKMWVVGKEKAAFKNEVLLPIIRKYNLNLGEEIIFHGFVSEEKKLELMSKSHTLLYPSDREGWGLTVTEAGAVGTPSIVYNSPGLIDAVDQGHAGYVTTINTSEGLFDIMKKSIEDEPVYQTMRNEAYKYSKKFQWSRTAKVLEAEMHQLLKEEIL